MESVDEESNQAIFPRQLDTCLSRNHHYSQLSDFPTSGLHQNATLACCSSFIRGKRDICCSCYTWWAFSLPSSSAKKYCRSIQREVDTTQIKRKVCRYSCNFS